MLIEELIRLGRPLVEGGLTPDEVLKIVTDVADTRTKNFFRNVFLAELPANDGDAPAVWRVQLGTDVPFKKKTTFQVDTNRAIGMPFTLPSGGDSLKPQGCYGLPVYPCWDPHLREFRESAEGVRNFLEGRLALTPDFSLSPTLFDALCHRIHVVACEEFHDDEKRLGILVLVRASPDGFYVYSRGKPRRDTLGESRLAPGAFIEPNLVRIVEAVWAARLAEGAKEWEDGIGFCSLTGVKERVVSAYCTVWPWAKLAWTCPMPDSGVVGARSKRLVLSVGAYRGLTMGASVFKRLTKDLQEFIIHEVFSPTTDGPGREIARQRKITSANKIVGAAFLLPVEDRVLSDEACRHRFADALLNQLAKRDEGATPAARQLAAVSGFDILLPEEFDSSDFRLTLVYFSGDISKSQIHLRAYIQDVLPSVATMLRDLAVRTAQEAGRLFEIVHLSQGRREYLYQCYKSVPYLLARGYGGSHLWNQLEQALHRRTLGTNRMIRNASARMASLAHRLPDSRYDLAEEAIFYLCCRDFIHNCNAGLTPAPGEEGMPMREWRVLLHAVEKGPITELCYANAAELGFGCGALVRQFSAMYWTETKSGDEGKDYLKHRVLTFGADLSPDLVRKVALRQMFEVAKRYEDLRSRFEGFLQERVGVTLTECDRLQDEVRKNRDEFMTAFWAGYSLQGYDVRKQKKNDDSDTAAATAEEMTA
jgi:hypothetical protein